MRKDVLELLGHTCMECASTENILIHHIDRDRSNNVLENLRVLCRACHVQTHYPFKAVQRFGVEIEDGLAERLRRYIDNTYDKSYGGITKVIEEALSAFLDRKETT